MSALQSAQYPECVSPRITLIFGIPIGVLPATGIGALTGFIIAWLLGANSAALSRTSAALLGITVAGIHIAIVTVLFGCRLLATRDGVGIYGFLIGVPSIIYIVLSGWKSMQLYMQIRQLNQ